MKEFLIRLEGRLQNLTPHDIGFFFVAVIMFSLAHFWYHNAKEIYKGFKGKDGWWQALEVFAYHVIWVWTGGQLADHFFGFRASSEAWSSLNIAVAVAVAGVSYKTYVQHSKPINETRIEQTTVATTSQPATPTTAKPAAASQEPELTL